MVVGLLVVQVPPRAGLLTAMPRSSTTIRTTWSFRSRASAVRPARRLHLSTTIRCGYRAGAARTSGPLRFHWRRRRRRSEPLRSIINQPSGGRSVSADLRHRLHLHHRRFCLRLPWLKKIRFQKLRFRLLRLQPIRLSKQIHPPNPIRLRKDFIRLLMHRHSQPQHLQQK